MNPSDFIVCRICKRCLPKTDFYKCRWHRTGRKTACKQCLIAKAKNRYKKMTENRPVKELPRLTIEVWAIKIREIESNHYIESGSPDQRVRHNAVLLHVEGNDYAPIPFRVSDLPPVAGPGWWYVVFPGAKPFLAAPHPVTPERPEPELDIAEIPGEIRDAALKLGNWMAENGHKNWKLYRCQERDGL